MSLRSEAEMLIRTARMTLMENHPESPRREVLYELERAAQNEKEADPSDQTFLNGVKTVWDQIQHVWKSEANWETKYDFIFKLGAELRKMGVEPQEYYDPDTSYEEDVTAFYNGLERALKGLFPEEKP